MPILSRILRDRGIVSEAQLREAIQHQVLYGGRLGTNLLELGFVEEAQLLGALARAHGVEAVPVEADEIRPETVKLVPKAVAARHKVFPYRLRGRTLFLLMVDPNDHASVARIGYSLGLIVKPLVVPEFRMIQLLRDHYGVDERWRYADTHTRRAQRQAPSGEEPGTGATRLDAAVTRDEVVQAVVTLCLGFFRRVIFFIVREPWVLGWNGLGEGLDRSLLARLRIPLGEASVFRTVARDKTHFLGRLGPEPQNQAFLRALGKNPATNAALVPILVRGRVVNLVYGDNGVSGNVRPDLGELLVALQKVPRAYLRIIRQRLAVARGEVDS